MKAVELTAVTADGASPRPVSLWSLGRNVVTAQSLKCHALLPIRQWVILGPGGDDDDDIED